MLLPQKDFPLFKKYSTIFPLNEDVIFAYDSNIYSNHKLPNYLIVHEETHLKQQETFGLDFWVNSYLYDKRFRLKAELEAYREEFKSIKDRNFRNKIRIHSARDLSSSLYGNIIDYQSAFNLLKI
jgi:hypothetical protein